MTLPSRVLIACDCGFAAEGRLRSTDEGARFWFGRCLGCGETLQARASDPFASALADAAEAPVGVPPSPGAAAPANAAAPLSRTRDRLGCASGVWVDRLGCASGVWIDRLGCASGVWIDRLGCASAWATLALAGALVALRGLRAG